MEEISAGAWLRRIRKEAGLAQGDVAKRAGFSQSRLCIYERGGVEPPLARWVAVCRAIGADPGAELTRMLSAQFWKGVE